VSGLGRTWIGVKCPGCSAAVPVLAGGRELNDGDKIEPDEMRELRRQAREGLTCPDCKTDLRDGVFAPAWPPSSPPASPWGAP
jgi:hypothetical protein